MHGSLVLGRVEVIKLNLPNPQKIESDTALPTYFKVQ